MKKVTVYFPVWAEYSVEVEIPDDKFEEEDFEDALEAAYDMLPSGLCHHCTTGNSGAGWTEHSEIYLAIGEQPEAHYILDELNKPVWGDPNKKLGW